MGEGREGVAGGSELVRPATPPHQGQGSKGSLPHVRIFTDGACSGNPGPGGWGAILKSGAHERELSGGERVTTNNRMELTAAISALEALKRPARVEIYTDSEYLRNGITQWIHNWRRNGWRTRTREPVRNAELWQRLDEALKPHQVSWHWVRGHAGHTENERADALARRAMAPFKKPIRKEAGIAPAKHRRRPKSPQM